MNRVEFLNKLDRLLKALGHDNVDEILRDYEEYFIEGAQMGKSEQEIIESLGDPTEIAKNYGKSKNRNVKAEKDIVKYNIRVVACKSVFCTMIFIMFLIASIALFVREKIVGVFVFMLLLDMVFLLFAILEFRKLYKYIKQQKNLNNIHKKDI